MRHKTLAVIVLFIIFSVAVGIAGAADTSQPSSDGIALAHKYAEGTTLRYRITQDLNGSRVFPGSTAPTKLAAKMTSVIKLSCSEVHADGSMELALEVEKAELSLNGRPATKYHAREGARRLRVTPMGKVLESGDGKTKSSAVGSTPLGLDSLESVVLMVGFPDKPVSTGEKWSAEIPLPIDPATTLHIDYQLQKVDSASGDRIAEIRQDLSTAAGSDRQDDTTDREGSQEGQADLKFSIDEGCLLSASGQVKTGLRTRVQMPSMPGTSVQQDSVSVLNIESKFTIELLPETEGPSNTSAE